MKRIKLEDINLQDIGHTVQIAGIIWSGKNSRTNVPLSFITQFPGKTETFENTLLLPLDLSEWLRVLRQTDILETEIIGEDENAQIIKAIVRKSQRNIDAYVSWDVFKRDNYTCRYCGRTGIPLTVDHIILWEVGGTTEPDNLVTACKSCNKDRGNLGYTEWLLSEVYLKKSLGLSDEAKSRNQNIVRILPQLEAKRVKNIRSRK